MQLEKDGMELSGCHCIVKVRRTMFDGKMSKILSGAGGASCQLCTVTVITPQIAGPFCRTHREIQQWLFF